MKTKISYLLCSAIAAIAAFSSLPLVGQEQTAPAIPVEDPTLSEPPKAPAAGSSEAAGAAALGATADYKEQIASGMKERERRLLLLNEAMIKLREAGEEEDAGRVEERIRALLEMPPPSQASNKLRAEIEQLRARNDELVIQMMAMDEELKRLRGPSKSTSSGRRTSSNTPASNPELIALDSSGAR